LEWLRSDASVTSCEVSFFGKFLLLPLLLLFSGCHLLFGCLLSLDADGPDEAQQLASRGSDDLPLVLACRRQSGIAFAMPDLRLPGNLLDLFRHPFLPFAQR
jgi:hypothetical protein